MEQSFYIRLITLADDYGRYEAHPALLASECFPYGDDMGLPVQQLKIDGMLRSLASKDLLIVYEKDGTKYLQLQRWKERIRSDSRYPSKNHSKILLQASETSERDALVGEDSEMPDMCPSHDGQMLASPPTPTPTPLGTGVPTSSSVPKAQGVRSRADARKPTRFDKPSLEQVRLFCAKSGILNSDADWFWNKMEGQGWKNGGKPVVSWERTLIAWKLAGYLASQKAQAKGQITPGQRISEAEKDLRRMARQLGFPGNTT